MQLTELVALKGVFEGVIFALDPAPDPEKGNGGMGEEKEK